MTEREIKLTLPGRFTLPPLTHGNEPLVAVPLPEQTLRATYFDTADLRLARQGVSMRYRTGEGDEPVWTLKLPVATSGSVLERNELHFAGTRRDPPAEARDLVTAYVRREPLVAVATLRTRRRRMRLETEDGEVAELADDEVSVIEDRRVVSRFRELEIEALRDELGLDGLTEQLHRAGATDVEPIPKVVRALGSRATAPPDVVAPTLPDEPTLADALAAAIADALVRLIRNDPLARLGDAEGIHQVRVAFRRLRSDLRTLGEAVDPDWRARVEPRLRQVGGALADARDLDVLIDGLRRDRDGGGRPLRRLFAALDGRRAAARSAMLEALADDAYPLLLDELVAAVRIPPIGPAAAEPAARALPQFVLDAVRRLDRRADDLHTGSADEDFHRARIAAKRARYAAELTARVLGGGSVASGATRLAERIADAQDQLGALQDSAVAETAIRTTLQGKGVSAPYAFEAGRLVERQRARGRSARAAFLAAWPELRRRKWRKWAM